MNPLTQSSVAARMTAGAGATSAAMRLFRLGEHPLVVRDAAVEPIGLALPPGATEIRLEAQGVDTRSIAEIVSAGSRATAVVALGGGSTLDAAKIARLLIVAPRLAVPLRTLTERSGFVRLPEAPTERSGSLPLLAVPTTFGTGSEVSSVACVVTPWGRRLLSSAELRPDHAALDPVHTATLPRRLQMEGLVEVILRVLGPAVGSRADLAADHDAEAIVNRTARLAEQLRVGFLAPDERLLAAQLSAASHRSWALVGRDTYAAKHWYLANELAWVTGSRKIPATIAILPTLWGRIEDGDRRWGSSERLAFAWSWVRAVVPDLPLGVRDGLRALFLRWGLHTIDAPSGRVRNEASVRAHTAWGGSLPALGHVDLEAIDQIFVESFPADADPIPTRREEVAWK
ncbi:MAG: iron-containing alcohol dehydrogenase [Microbacterium sp.]